ncbi:D-glycerate dehydrogenase [Halalkalibacillus sediminis]|uniref:D-glycerate dehydrogenase n=1 Tax=Halalkalibacillus sediminis TaxID=2018042 RepID=A0A2I0QUY7_9BACI|nr:D-glycerate dehydrogenase [Halalkalibacillus sediminis]PKR78104.1 D-glycerate dehydrogenase [Halalkalibacillus sediminis]
MSDKKKVYICRMLPESVVSPLKKEFEVEMWPHEDQPVTKEELNAQSKDAHALLTMLTDPIDEDLLANAENLEIVSNLAVGYDNINLNAAKKQGVVVTNTPDVLTDTTADLTFALLMATARRIPEGVDFIKEDQWTTWSPLLLAGADIHHKTIGIVGMGKIGEAVARRAKGFDMKILYHNRSRKESAEREIGATYVDFDQLLAESDFVVCMTPLTEETDGMFNGEAFKKMKNSAIFINSSRGKVVNEKDLQKALEKGKIKAAGLDVFEQEPIRSSHPLLELDNVVALPHIGSSSVETRHKMMELTVNNISNVLNGEKAITPIK